MGKILIIKGADFSEVAIGKVTPLGYGPSINITAAGLVTITDGDASAIYYTTDGSTPTTGSTQYNGTFSVNSGTTVKAISEYDSGVTTGVVSKKYVKTTILAVTDISDKYIQIGDASEDLIVGSDSNTYCEVDVSEYVGKTINLTTSGTLDTNNANWKNVACNAFVDGSNNTKGHLGEDIVVSDSRVLGRTIIDGTLSCSVPDGAKKLIFNKIVTVTIGELYVNLNITSAKVTVEG